jgi:integrase
MAKKAKELSALAVKGLVKPGLHAVGGVAGLALQVSVGGGRSWVLRYNVGTKRRALGLGGFPEVALADARDAAREARSKVGGGSDPIEERKAQRRALIASQATAITFRACAETYIATVETSFRNAKHRQQWKNTLATYAYPQIGQLVVGNVEQADVLKVLEPIWHSKTETAKRLRGRIENILDWATGRKFRSGDNPARWKESLKAQLPAPNKITKVVHHPAIPVEEMPAFMVRLRACDGIAARALEFAILTAARSGEVFGARRDEIDFHSHIWTVPEARMKANKQHRVPLSPAAMKIIAATPEFAESPYIFTSPRGGMLSAMSMTAVMRRLKVEAVPHGVARSSFRDWAAECTNYPRDVAEMALSHAIGNRVEAAYRRGDLFFKRISMMNDWSDYCATPIAANVIEMNNYSATYKG